MTLISFGVLRVHLPLPPCDFFLFPSPLYPLIDWTNVQSVGRYPPPAFFDLRFFILDDGFSCFVVFVGSVRYLLVHTRMHGFASFSLRIYSHCVLSASFLIFFSSLLSTRLMHLFFHVSYALSLVPLKGYYGFSVLNSLWYKMRVRRLSMCHRVAWLRNFVVRKTWVMRVDTIKS